MKTLLILVIVLLIVVLASLFLVGAGNENKCIGRYQMIVMNHEEVEKINYGKNGAVAANKPYFYIFDIQKEIAIAYHPILPGGTPPNYAMFQDSLEEYWEGN